MVVQFALAALVRNVWASKFRPPHNPGRRDYALVRSFIYLAKNVYAPFRQKVVPTAVATGLDIGLSNLSLKLITLSFYSEYYYRFFACAKMC